MPKLITLLVLILISSSFANAQLNSSLKLFKLSQLTKDNTKTEGKYLGFLNESVLDMGLYELKVREVDRQQPHPRDEVYYITGGVATLQVGNDSIPVKAGSIVFVKTKVPHRFTDIKKDLQVLVFFSNSASSADDPAWKHFQLNDFPFKPKPGEIIRNEILNVATLRIGLYSLAGGNEGYETISQKEDGVNIVVSGRGTFMDSNDEVEIKPGSLLYSAKGTELLFKNYGKDIMRILTLHHKSNE